MGDFHGIVTGTINNSSTTIKYLLDAGPRIIGLFHKSVPDNLFIEIPDKTHQTKYGTYFFRGGHRLWHAPEDNLRTYIPDNGSIRVTQEPNEVTMTQQVEAFTGIQKSIHIKLHPDLPQVVVQHTLLNCGLWPITLSAWAITQLPLGGVALLPQTTDKVDVNGLLPNRSFSLWSYASIKDPRLTLADDLFLIEAGAALPPLKIGYANQAGWLGYFRNSTLFIKHFTPIPELPHPDFNCNAEVYCGDQFIELETLSPLKTIEPGESIVHFETWEIIPCLQPPPFLFDYRNLLVQAGLAIKS